MQRPRAPSPATAWLDRVVASSPSFREKVERELAAIDVAQDLVALRHARGLSQAQLARHLGISQSAVAQLESGGARNVGLRTLVRTAVALNGRVEIRIRARNGR